jgi:hypothetical protein
MFRKQTNTVSSTAHHVVRKPRIGMSLLLVVLLGLVSTALASAQTNVYLPVVTGAAPAAPSGEAAEAVTAVGEEPAVPNEETTASSEDAGDVSPAAVNAYNATNWYVSGNLGVGTDLPRAKVHVRGPVMVAYPASTVLGVHDEFIATIGSESWLDTPTISNRELRIQRGHNGGQINQYILYNGRISNFGTPTPVDSPANLTVTQGVWGRFAGMEFYNNGDIYFLIGDGSYSANAQRAIKPNRAMMVQHTGNIGIGTMTPQAKLDVAGTTRTDILQIDAGGDLAEPFDIAGTETIEPGMVVAIVQDIA